MRPAVAAVERRPGAAVTAAPPAVTDAGGIHGHCGTADALVPVPPLLLFEIGETCLGREAEEGVGASVGCRVSIPLLLAGIAGLADWPTGPRVYLQHSL